MQSSIYVALAAQRVLQHQIDTIANNVANMNTVGFRAESINFNSLVSNAEPDGVQFPVVGKTTPSSVPGTLEATGNSLDIALSGPGWFAIETPQGVAYTRDGRLSIDSFGELRSVGDYPILDAAQAPILVNPDGGEIEITPDGRVRQNDRIVGNIGVFDVPENAVQSRFENSAFFSSVEALPIAPGDRTTITQGFVENSNVDPIGQLANMITVQRYFESLNASIKDSEESLDRSIREIGEPQG